MSRRNQYGFFPFLYLLFFCLWQYSVNDMASSSNAYTLQVQSERTMVYVYLFAILGLMGLFVISRGTLKFVPTTKPLFFLILWTLADNLILGNIIGSSNQWASFTQIGLCAWWFLAVIFGTKYIENEPQKEKQLVFLIMLVFVYYCYEFIRVAINNSRVYDQTTILNLIYRVIVFVPLIFLLNNKKIRNISLFLVIILTVISFKRGAIIILPIMLMEWYLVENRGKKISGNQIVKFSFILLVVVTLLVYADRLTEGFLSYRFSTQQLLFGSSRDVKYATAISEISDRGIVSLLLGIGSSHRSGIHNEVLEVTYTYGIIGLVIYLWYIFSMLKRYKALLQSHSQYASIYGMIFLFVFVVGLYSGVIFTHSTFYLMLTLGIIENKIVNEEIDYA